MSEESPLEDLRRFLLEHVATYEELDVLLLLVRRSGTSWSAKSVAETLGASTDDCRVALEGLVARGLLAAGQDSVTFRYSPTTDEIAHNVDTLERTYREPSFCAGASQFAVSWPGCSSSGSGR